MRAGGPFRVLVASRSAVHRSSLVAALEADPDLAVMGCATSGPEAIRAVAALQPDVIALDLHWPVADDLAAARQIMRDTPTPIVMVAGDELRENAQLSADALQAGALAFVARPAGTQADLELKHLRHVIKDVAAVRLDDRWFGVRHSSTRTEWPERGAPKPPQIIAIGASTGGPHALHEILTRLPATFPTPLVIVQHIGEGFDGGLVSWLGSQCALPVQLGVAGARLDRPGIHIAPTGHHLGVRGRRIELTNAPPVSGHRPSATLLFRSVAEEYQAAAVGILLTGMGNDGAAGLRALREAGATTVAQDRLSSVVFGMPSVAIDDGVVDYVLSPEAMVALLVNTLVPSGGR